MVSTRRSSDNSESEGPPKRAFKALSGITAQGHAGRPGAPHVFFAGGFCGAGGGAFTCGCAIFG